jgi:hypothetical protein
MPPDAPLPTVVREWARMGALSFGGPPAQIALLRELCVERRRWIDEREFEDANAACQLLPGPASTQMAIYCALRVGGVRGALVGGLGFIVPGLLMVLAIAALALGEAPPELRPVARQGPRRSLASRPRRVLGDPAPDREAALELRPDPLRLDRAAAERDDPAALERLEAQALLGLAKPRLAVALEDVGRERAELVLDPGVQVHPSLAEDGRRSLRRPRLARSHEPDKRDRRSRGVAPGRYLRHPIRSS